LFSNTFNNQDFIWKLGFKVSNIYFDPEFNLISKGNSVIKADSFEFSKGYSIVPNPVSDYLYIQFLIEQNFDLIYITDISGKKVIEYDKIGYNKQFKFNLSNLKQGIYFIILKNPNTTIKEKIVKK
jgi:hypothetical protein